MVLKAVSITSDGTFTSVVFAICVESEISDISKPEQTKPKPSVYNVSVVLDTTRGKWGN